MNDLILSQPEPTLPRPVGKPSDLLIYHDHMTQLIRDVLKEGTDYGIIPGTSKHTLYKPGAERINMAFGTRPEYIAIEKEVDHFKEVPWKKNKKDWDGKTSEGISYGVYRYVFKCLIVKQGSDHFVIGEGMGSASSLESKYIDRPRDLENTIMKMAMKRAYISATLSTFGLSERFAQILSEPVKPRIFNSKDEKDIKAFLDWIKNGAIKLSEDEENRALGYLDGKPFSEANEAVRKAKEPKE